MDIERHDEPTFSDCDPMKPGRGDVDKAVVRWEPDGRGTPALIEALGRYQFAFLEVFDARHPGGTERFAAMTRLRWRG